MDRGIQATVVGLEEAKKALKLKGWTQDYLAGGADCTRQTVSKFLAGKRIEKRIFQDICSELDLKWGEIAELEAEEKADRPLNIEELVETIRVNIYDSIQTKCGSMRVLDMTQPIDLNAIYININILEEITGRQRLNLQELRQSYSLENYDRFSLTDVKEPRIPALDAVDKYAKLMILGKPGAGKTTFLKYVALQCIEGLFKSDLIPLFITLKDFSEDDHQPTLLSYITRIFNCYGIESRTKIQKGLWDSVLHGSTTNIEFLLMQGRFLIFLDGLDEVREVDSKRVVRQIKDFSNLFTKNLFVITCRIAAKEYTFEKFTDVEVADFDSLQISTFAKQWFHSKNDPIKADNFIEKLRQDKSIRDLAHSPLLLTLLCFVFGDSGSFPVNRSELYKEGLDVLIKKWDATRNIERDQVYKKLSLKRREDLLSQIALDTFEKGNYFFKQKEAERYITQYIRNLPDANLEEELLQLDSEAVLKSIESQHGLFVERARGIYSFSHLTFHEYFAARKIVTNSNFDSSIQKFAAYITDKRWREVLLLTVGMLENADLLMEAMKRNIDRIIYQDEQLQEFLLWVDQKSFSVKSDYKPAAIRAYYLNFICNQQDVNININCDIYVALDSDIAHAFSLDLSCARDIIFVIDVDVAIAAILTDCLALNIAIERSQSIQNNYDIACRETREVIAEHNADLNQNLVRNREHTLKISWDQSLDIVNNLVLNIVHTLDIIHSYSSKTNELYQLTQQIKNHRNFYNWWIENGKNWTQQLKSIAIKNCNIGHDWQFSDSQKQLLQQYYDANKLLVECLNSDCYVSREVRESIESTLLLPISSIEKLKSGK
jgi:predicted NACHT family NTPase